MTKDEAVGHLKVVYDKMAQDYLDRGLFAAAQEIWPLKDYRSLLEMLSREDWAAFASQEQDLIGGVFARYFGRGEFVNGYCPKKISYQESHAAHDALEWVAAHFIKPSGSGLAF